MLRNSPPALDIHYAFCVRNVKGPWTEGQRRQIMEWYASVQSKSGGNSYKKFLARMQGDMLKNATEGERKMVAGWKLPQPKSLFDGIPSPKGPGKTYTVAEVAKIGSDLSQANLENGKKMFKATLCYACHRVGGDGGSAGPDLSAVGGRFTVADIADSAARSQQGGFGSVSVQYSDQEGRIVGLGARSAGKRRGADRRQQCL